MPMIPTFENDVAVPRAPGPPLADADSYAQGGEQLAQGASQVSGQMAQFNAVYQDARRQADAANITADASAQLGDAQFRWSKIPDRDAATAGFQQEAAQIKTRTLAGVQDPRVASYVSGRIDNEAIVRQLDTQNAAFGLESEKRRGDLDLHLAQYAQQAGATDDPHMQALATDNAMAEIQGTVAGHWLPPDQAAARAIQFRDRVGQTQALSFIRQMNELPPGQRPDPITISNMIDDPNDPRFAGMQPTTRQSVTDTAIRLGRTIATMEGAAQAHADAMADKTLRQTQAANETELLTQTYAGKPPDLIQIEQLSKGNQISPSGLEAIHSAMIQQKEGTDDPVAANQLYGQLGAGSDIQPEISGALSAGKLSSRTAIALMNANRAQQENQFPNAGSKVAFDQLKTALGGSAAESGIVMPGEKADDAAARRANWAQAQGEYFQRTLVGKENPQAVIADMLPRYGATQTQPSTWQPPRFAPQGVNSLADVNAAAVATYRARQAGQLDDGGYEAEVQKLNRFRAYYQQQTAQQNAAAAARAGAPVMPPAPGGK